MWSRKITNINARTFIFFISYHQTETTFTYSPQTFVLIINTLRLTAYAKRKEIKIMRTIGASATYIRLPFIFEAVFESLIGTSIAVGLGWGFIQYSKTSFIAESIFDIAISDSYLINLTLVLLLSTIIFGFFASFVGIRKVLND